MRCVDILCPGLLISGANGFRPSVCILRDSLGMLRYVTAFSILMIPD